VPVDRLRRLVDGVLGVVDTIGGGGGTRRSKAAGNNGAVSAFGSLLFFFLLLLLLLLGVALGVSLGDRMPPVDDDAAVPVFFCFGDSSVVVAGDGDDAPISFAVVDVDAFLDFVSLFADATRLLPLLDAAPPPVPAPGLYLEGVTDWNMDGIWRLSLPSVSLLALAGAAAGADEDDGNPPEAEPRRAAASGFHFLRLVVGGVCAVLAFSLRPMRASFGCGETSMASLDDAAGLCGCVVCETCCMFDCMFD